jgi:hypothetical protein
VSVTNLPKSAVSASRGLNDPKGAYKKRTVKGRDFLRLHNEQEIEVTSHTCARFAERTGRWLPPSLLRNEFENLEQVRPEVLRLLGYSTRYGKRMAKGERSFYFIGEYCGREYIAVVTQCCKVGKPVWVTTLGPNSQTLAFRSFTREEVINLSPPTGFYRIRISRADEGPKRRRKSPKRPFRRVGIRSLKEIREWLDEA